MKRNFLIGICSFLTLIPAWNVSADILLVEDFEDSTITYTTSVTDDLSDISNKDYFGRIAADTSSLPSDVSYSNQQGSGFYGVQDVNGVPGQAALETVELNWTVDTSNYTNLELSWFVGEDDATDGNEDWDDSTSFRIAVQSDGGGFTDIFAIESEDAGGGDMTNERPLVDTNFDGVGDGVEITDIMSQFSSSLADAGSIDIRVTFDNLVVGDEDLAFDNLQLTGDLVAIPEPTGTLAIGALLIGLFARRRRV